MSAIGIFQCVADRLDIDVCDAKNARMLRSIVKSVMARAEKMTNRKLCARANIVECLAPADYGNKVKLGTWPLIRLHKVECLHCSTEYDDVCIDSVGRSCISRCCGWCKCSCGPSHFITGGYQPDYLKKTIRVTYDAGYVTDDQAKDPSSPFYKHPVTMPADLFEALCQVAAGLWTTQCTPPNVKSMSNLGASVTYRDDASFPQHLKDSILCYAEVCI